MISRILKSFLIGFMIFAISNDSWSSSFDSLHTKGNRSNSRNLASADVSAPINRSSSQSAEKDPRDGMREERGKMVARIIVRISGLLDEYKGDVIKEEDWKDGIYVGLQNILERVCTLLNDLEGDIKIEHQLVDLQNELIDLQNSVSEELEIMSREKELDSDQVKKVIEKGLIKKVSEMRSGNIRKILENTSRRVEQIKTETDIRGYNAIKVDRDLKNLHDSSLTLIKDMKEIFMKTKNRDKISINIEGISKWWIIMLGNNIKALKEKNEKNMPQPSSWELLYQDFMLHK